MLAHINIMLGSLASLFMNISSKHFSKLKRTQLFIGRIYYYQLRFFPRNQSLLNLKIIHHIFGVKGKSYANVHSWKNSVENNLIVLADV